MQHDDASTSPDAAAGVGLESAPAPDAAGPSPVRAAAEPPPVDLAELVRAPKQARSRRTLDRIVEAAHALLASDGPGALAVTSIAARAKTSVGSFYARFDGKDELVRYLGESALQRALAGWRAELAVAAAGPDPTLFERMRHLSEFLLEGFREGDLGRVVALDRIQDPAPSRLHRLRSRLLEDMEGICGDAGAPELAAAVAARMTLATVQSMGSGSLAGDPSRPAGEVARAVSLYLGAPVPDRDAAAVHPKAPQEDGSAPPASSPTRSDVSAETPPDSSDEAPAPDRPDPVDPVDPFDVWG